MCGGGFPILDEFVIISGMKHTLRGKKRWIVIGLLVVIIAAGGAIAAWQMDANRQHDDWSRDVIDRTNVADYSDLSEDDLQDRSKAVFGKSIDELASSDIKKTTKSDGTATAYEAAKLLAAAGKTDKSLEAYEVAATEQKQVDQDLYRDYRNTLDTAGRHDEATELMRQELAALKRQTPRDDIAIMRVESQIGEREEYYK